MCTGTGSNNIKFIKYNIKTLHWDLKFLQWWVVLLLPSGCVLHWRWMQHIHPNLFSHIYRTTECRMPESHNLESLVLSCSAAEDYIFWDGATWRWVHTYFPVLQGTVVPSSWATSPSRSKHFSPSKHRECLPSESRSSQREKILM